jgi:PAS domain S-box-containing protein
MKRALVVDDKEENLYYLTSLLTGHGYIVDTAYNGVEALAKAQESLPDIVISDLLMPVMDGYKLLNAWRSDPQFEDIRFIVYTATYTSAEDERLALDMGADAYIVKPAEPEPFMARLRQVEASPTARPRGPGIADNASLMRQYSDVLVRKLEDKVAEQEATNRALQHEIALRERQAETQRAILDTLPALVALVDPDGTILAVNEAWRKSSLSDDGNYVAAFATLEGEHAADAATGIRKVLRGQASQFSIEYQCDTQAGSRWFRLMAAPLVPDQPGGAVLMHLDITERRQHEALLAQQAALLDNAKDAIVVRDLEHRIQYWNRAAERLFGWTRDEAVGRRIDDFLHKPDASRLRDAKETVLRTGAWSGRVTKSAKDGKRVTVEGNWTLVRDDTGRPASIFSIDTDIADRLDLETRLIQSQKLEAVGQLTGGIAHDFNNLLGVISGNLELLAEALKDRPDLVEMLESSIRATERGATLTRSLLAFSRQQPLDPRPVDPNLLLREMTQILRRTVSESIGIDFVPNATWYCDADPGQLQNALLNLVLNARDAMPDGGRLTIETADAALDEVYAAGNNEVSAGDYVAIAVSDTGTGMAADVVARAFEPFFTTKEVGKGTGLGLSMVYGFAKQSRGHAKIYSEIGHGTTVRLYLPRSRGNPEIVAPAATAAEEQRGQGETILVVEDDEDMRALTFELLRSLGYTVLAATDGRSALAVLRAKRQIDLLLTDVVLPGGMNGRVLAATAVMQNPKMGVVFMSGYTENAIVHKGRLDPGVRLLQKPFSKRSLAETIRAALDRVPRP